jgi:two-component system response regulator
MEIKEDGSLKNIPVMILTISQAEIDVISAYYLHANAYVNKPLDFDQFINIVKSTASFWLGIVKLLTK